MAGDDARFTELFATHHDAIRSYCHRRLPVHDANEATADVFTVAWRRIDDAPAGDDVLPWLYGVARNVVRTHRRGSVRRRRLIAKAGSLAPGPTDGPASQVIRHAEHVEVLEALSAMREADQDLLRLKAWEELSNRTIGDILGISEHAVESRYTRALARLAKRLGSNTNSGRSPLSRTRGGERR